MGIPASNQPALELTFQANLLDEHLRAPLAWWDRLAALTCMTVLALCALAHLARGHVPYDYSNYIRTASGDFSHYYYAHWFLPVFFLLSKLPLLTGYLLWGTLNLYGAFFAVRVFGGSALLALLSFQMFYILYFGQITGIILGGLALFWWEAAHRRLDLAGLGLLIATTKYQLGLPLVLFLWLAADLSWRERLRCLLVPAIVLTASLVVSPSWPLRSLDTIMTNPPNDWGSISLWRWIGPWALLLFLPPLVLRRSLSDRLVMFAAAAALAMPYFQQTDLLFLFVLPVGWTALAGNLGYPLMAAWSWNGLPTLAIVPAWSYLEMIFLRKQESANLH